VGWEKVAKPLGERATEVLAEGTKLVKKTPVRPDRTHRRQLRLRWSRSCGLCKTTPL